MADVGNYQGRRLWNATVTAFAVLDRYGFRVGAARLEWERGADVVVANATVTITVQADWLERELVVWVQVAGARPMRVEQLIPDFPGLRRLPRSPTRGVLQRRLGRVAQALQVHAPEILQGGQRALARVLDAGGEVA
ncbi:hypothetical protein [Micromonospora vulcania]|uniref:Uncharacterized protein n=1 Tax=Micromonospora vulcania TaxID=1441873 RepID=A0ABW1H4Y8_9ACTN